MFLWPLPDCTISPCCCAVPLAQASLSFSSRHSAGAMEQPLMQHREASRGTVSGNLSFVSNLFNWFRKADSARFCVYGGQICRVLEETRDKSQVHIELENKHKKWIPTNTQNEHPEAQAAHMLKMSFRRLVLAISGRRPLKCSR